MWYHWLIFGLIFLIAPFSLTYFFNTVLKKIELTEEQKKHKDLTIGMYILLIWLYDLLYMTIFNKWVVLSYIFGIVVINISIVNITKALINDKKNVINLLPFELIIVLGLSIYLIYIIEDTALQSIITTIIAAVYGGLFTLIGVAWTIRKGDKDRKADLTRREKERKEDLERLEKVRKEDLARIDDERREEEKKKAKPIFTYRKAHGEEKTDYSKKTCFALTRKKITEEDFDCIYHEFRAEIENSNNAGFYFKRIFLEDNWYEIQGNTLCLTNSMTTFFFRVKTPKFFILETEDFLNNKYYFQIDMCCSSSLSENTMLFTIEKLFEISMEEVEKITKVNP